MTIPQGNMEHPVLPENADYERLSLSQIYHVTQSHAIITRFRFYTSINRLTNYDL